MFRLVLVVVAVRHVCVELVMIVSPVPLLARVALVGLNREVEPGARAGAGG